MWEKTTLNIANTPDAGDKVDNNLRITQTQSKIFSEK